MKLEKLNPKNWGQVFLTSFTLITIFLIVNLTVQTKVKTDLRDQFAQKVATAVNSATAIATGYMEEVKAGKMTLEEAKKKFLKEIVDASKYNTVKDAYLYAFKYDKSSKDIFMVRHPIKPELNNSNLNTYDGGTGVYFFRDFAKALDEKDNGYILYPWPKPGENKNSDKLAYFQAFKDFDIVIASGVYTDDVELALWNLTFELNLVLIIPSIFALLFTFMIVRFTRSQVNQIIEITQDVLKGNLTKRIEVKNKNTIIGQVQVLYNDLLENFHKIVSEVREKSQKITQETRSISNNMAVIATNADNANSKANEIATGTEEMGATSQDVARNCNNNAETSRYVQEIVNEGMSDVQETISSSKKASQGVLEVSKAVIELSQKASEIDKIGNIISTIADQTNLLALNAAIEAARAGEHGRGFAVVADEVRALAAKSLNSVKEIGNITTEIQTSSVNASKLAEQTVDNVSDALEKAVNSGEKLELISQEVNKVVDKNTEIATATEQQDSVIGQNAVLIADVAHAMMKSTDEIKDASVEIEALSHEANDLTKMVLHYIVGIICESKQKALIRGFFMY